jgi:hypothetical protein
MITKVSADGIKGLPKFEQPLSRLNLLTGQNGVGKTARADALTLAVLGYIPGSAKKNNEILSTYGAGDKLHVAFETEDRTHFYRRFCREGDSVSQNLMLNRKKANAKEFAAAMAGVKVFDLKAFMDLSDRAKIDWISALFPPSENLAAIDEQIESQKAKQNSLTAKIRALDDMKARLNSARAEINLPAGTLAEVAGQIREMEERHHATQKHLEQVRIEAARAEAEVKAKTELREEVKAEVKAEVQSEVWQQQQTQQQTVQEQLQQTRTNFDNSKQIARERGSFEFYESLKAILATMQRTDCDACAAALVCKREIRKYKPMEVA